MKNNFIFLMGIIILLATVWLATMAGLKANEDIEKEENLSFYSSLSFCSDNYQEIKIIQILIKNN